ncbi:MAG: phage tail tube protein [Bacillota bacterium]|nr:phage tail tube protein [Bacillota bacterium]
MSIYLKIADGVDGKQGEAWITVDGVTKELVGLQKIEALDTVNERTMKTVGTVKTQTAMGSVDGSGTMTLHYCALPTFARMIEKYRKTGKITRFDLIIINDDPGTSLGRRSASFTDCVLSGDVPLAVLDATTDEHLTVDLNFKYSDYTQESDFNEPKNIGRE